MYKFVHPLKIYLLINLLKIYLLIESWTQFITYSVYIHYLID